MIPGYGELDVERTHERDTVISRTDFGVMLLSGYPTKPDPVRSIH
jgi:hypothetical protein